jgi:hypothetical protein
MRYTVEASSFVDNEKSPHETGKRNANIKAKILPQRRGDNFFGEKRGNRSA